ncbi:MAG: hypothetical protein K2P76_00010 [Lachnospiraceae bacterium]|nr:hypothetical protein [Lachnospiraceae bacterium]
MLLWLLARCMWRKPSYICLITRYSSGMAMSRACRRRRCLAPLTLTARCCTSPAHAMFPVIMPHMKQASSRATAVLATFAFLPFDNTIL